MKKVTVIGKFHTTDGVVDGQAVKTNIVYEEIVRAYSGAEVSKIVTFGWRKNPAKLFLQCVKAVFSSKNVLFLTDEGGIKVFPRLLQMVNLGHKSKIHYYVVGGWLSNYLDSSESAVKLLQKLDAIYVELPAMQRELEERGFHNTVLVNKFRRMNPVSYEELNTTLQEPYKLCYFSRVMREKGIEDCISAVKLLNDRAGYVKYTLDIFGLINEPYRETFEQMIPKFPDYIRYNGIVDFQKSSSVLKDYFVMLFPTSYTSEGYPNAVVDAFSAGLPVIATRWHYNADIIHEGEDGFLVDVGNVEQIISAIEKLSADSNLYSKMRENCLKRCSEYLPEYAVRKVIEQMK